MQKALLALLAALAIALLAVACGDDDDGTTPTGGETPAGTKPSSTGDAQETPANGDLKTPVDQTPGPGETLGPSDTGPRATPAIEGTPAPFLEDPNAFFSSKYPGVSPNESDCDFNPVTFVVTCDGSKYAVDPPLQGQDVTCALLSVEDNPVVVRCTSQDPLQSIYYEIQG